MLPRYRWVGMMLVALRWGREDDEAALSSVPVQSVVALAIVDQLILCGLSIFRGLTDEGQHIEVGLNQRGVPSVAGLLKAYGGAHSVHYPANLLAELMHTQDTLIAKILWSLFASRLLKAQQALRAAVGALLRVAPTASSDKATSCA